MGNTERLGIIVGHWLPISFLLSYHGAEVMMRRRYGVVDDVFIHDFVELACLSLHMFSHADASA